MPITEELRELLAAGNAEEVINWMYDEVSNLSMEDLELVLGFISESWEKSEIANTWIEQPNRTKEDLALVLGLISEPWDKYRVASNWIKQPNRPKEDLALVLGLISESRYKYSVANTWIEQPNRTKEDLAFAFRFIPEPQQKSNLATNWIKKLPSETKRENFLDFAKQGIFLSLYNVKEITSVYLQCQLPIEDFVNLGAELYPNNENLQAEVLKEFVRRINKDDLLANKDKIKNFIKSLHDDNEVLTTLGEVKAAVRLTNLEILKIADDRLSEKYESISNLLKEKKLSEALTEEGLINAKDLLQINDEALDQITLAGLFSYFDLISEDSGSASLKSAIKPEVLGKIAANFTPSDKKSFLFKSEADKLFELLNDAGGLEMPPVKEISTYLKGNLPEFSKLDPAEIDHFQLGESTIIAGKEGLNEMFRDLLKAKPAKEDDVASFFENALGLEGEINSTNRKILKDFFNRDKFLLASLLQKNGGLDKFSGIITSLADGCFANIGTQSRIALCSSLIPDRKNQILFSVFQEKINQPILNITMVDHPEAGSDFKTIFEDVRINENFISPTGLVKSLCEEFYKNGKILRNAWEEVINPEMTGVSGSLLEIFEKIAEKTGGITTQKIDEQAAKIAAYIILEGTLPQVLNSKYLKQFKEESESLIEGARNITNAGEEEKKARVELPQVPSTAPELSGCCQPQPTPTSQQHS